MPAKHTPTQLGDGPGDERVISNPHLLPALRNGAFPRGDGHPAPRPEGERARAPFQRIDRRMGKASMARGIEQEAA